ncbi:hypothetical protein TNCT_234571 [Trichonephila clavata]|uniref:Uncharacterized protein n=1 Tax=Trichonephila clavata TaxID=2740835 RepID=A0A8X6GEA1_TRICU|nr:hypothetical protein TNCT_234571 [Trichonephila clavata]
MVPPAFVEVSPRKEGESTYIPSALQLVLVTRFPQLHPPTDFSVGLSEEDLVVSHDYDQMSTWRGEVIMRMTFRILRKHLLHIKLITSAELNLILSVIWICPKAKQKY